MAYLDDLCLFPVNTKSDTIDLGCVFAVLTTESMVYSTAQSYFYHLGQVIEGRIIMQFPYA